jgi:hypothetical protein
MRGELMSKLLRQYTSKLLARTELVDGVPYWSKTKTREAKPMAYPFCTSHPFELLTDSVAYVLETGDLNGLVIIGETPKAKLDRLLLEEYKL